MGELAGLFMSTSSNQPKPSVSELIYRLDDKPPLPQTLFAALQHLLAMFVAVVTPSLIICQALGLTVEQTNTIVSMSLFASGIASLIQIRTIGPFGSGLLSIQGTSFNFLGPIIGAGLAMKAGGSDTDAMMAAIFGTIVVAAFSEILIFEIARTRSKNYNTTCFGYRCNTNRIDTNPSGIDVNGRWLCSDRGRDFWRAEKSVSRADSAWHYCLVKSSKKSLFTNFFSRRRYVRWHRFSLFYGDGEIC